VARCRHTRPDLLTNLLPRTFPYGIAVEIIRIEALASALPRMNPQDREHLTRVFYSHPNDYRIESLRCPHPGLEAARLVVDTEADLAEFERLAREFGRRVETAPYHQVAARALAGLPSAEGS
jgi:spore coat polysaccharide biosynthesis protein SpsF